MLRTATCGARLGALPEILPGDEVGYYGRCERDLRDRGGAARDGRPSAGLWRPGEPSGRYPIPSSLPNPVISPTHQWSGPAHFLQTTHGMGGMATHVLTACGVVTWAFGGAWAEQRQTAGIDLMNHPELVRGVMEGRNPTNGPVRARKRVSGGRVRGGQTPSILRPSGQNRSAHERVRTVGQPGRAPAPRSPDPVYSVNIHGDHWTSADVDSLIREATVQGILRSDLNTLRNQCGLSHFESPAASAKLATFLKNVAPGLLVEENGQRGARGRRTLQPPAVRAADLSSSQYAWIDGATLWGPSGPTWDEPLLGHLSNCVGISALVAAIAADPGQVARNLKDNGDGTYTGRFFEFTTSDAPPREVTLTQDGRLPCVGSQCVYSRGRNPKHIGPAIVEKLQAFHQGGYEAIGNGTTMLAERLRFITGKWAEDHFVTGTPGQVLASIAAARAQGKAVMAASCRPESAPADISDVVWGHAYAVIKTGDQDQLPYILLREPTGGMLKLSPEKFTRAFIRLAY